MCFQKCSTRLSHTGLPAVKAVFKQNQHGNVDVFHTESEKSDKVAPDTVINTVMG